MISPGQTTPQKQALSPSHLRDTRWAAARNHGQGAFGPIYVEMGRKLAIILQDGAPQLWTLIIPINYSYIYHKPLLSHL